MPEMLPGPDADLAGGRGREFRVTAGLSGPGRHEVCELVDKPPGLKVLIGDLERWQALAIVSILHPPFDQ